MKRLGHFVSNMAAELLCVRTYSLAQSGALLFANRIQRPLLRRCAAFLHITNRRNTEEIQSSKTKLVKVALIGEPNSGKSTLTNSLVGQKICAVTEIPHTTRQQTCGAFIQGATQVVLMDTPGVVTYTEGRRLKMTRRHITAPDNALCEANVIAVISDAAAKRTRERIHEQILSLLANHREIPSILVLSKTDKIKHKVDLLELTALLSEDRQKDEWGYKETGGWGNFRHVFMVSAKRGDGVNDLTNYFVELAKSSDWAFPLGTHTDLSYDERITEIFREKLLQLYEHEIPWQIKQVTVLFDKREDGKVRIHQKLYCRKKSQARCVIEKLSQLNTLVVADLEDVLGGPVHLTVDVGVKSKIAYDVPLPTF